MWERGNRYNVGVPELHASSLGFVKVILFLFKKKNFFLGSVRSGKWI